MEPISTTMSVQQPSRLRAGEHHQQPAAVALVAPAGLPEAPEMDSGESPAQVPTAAEVEQLDHLLQQHQQHLSFSVDEASGVSVMKVIDTESGDVIRQMPGESWLKLARELAESSSGLLRDRA